MPDYPENLYLGPLPHKDVVRGWTEVEFEGDDEFVDIGGFLYRTSADIDYEVTVVDGAGAEWVNTEDRYPASGNQDHIYIVRAAAASGLTAIVEIP